MNGDRTPHEGKHRPSQLAVREEAITTAGALRTLEFSRETIVFELRAKYGYGQTEAVRIVREAVRRDPDPDTPRVRNASRRA